MSIERRLQALEAQQFDRPAQGRRLTLAETDLVLSSFERSERQLSAAEQIEARRLIAICRTGLTESQLDAALAEFEHCPELEIEPC